MSEGLSLERLVVKRGGLDAVSDLSFSNRGPAWIGIVGANGSGKTTLLRAVAGRLPVAAGRIVIAGSDLTQDRARRAELVGFAVNESLLPAELTPREVFAISARTRSAADDPALGPLRRALKLESFLDRKCGALSAGMGHRVTLMAAFLDLPKIVILDEPFNWLDPLTAYDVKQALRALVSDCDIMLITALHDISTLTSYCQRGILMSGGKIALTLEEADLRAAMSDPKSFEQEIVQRLRSQ